jgi:peptidoglycan hydrolase-like protein with peptidoglycan-binding domain
MHRILFLIIAFSCALLFVPLAGAQSHEIEYYNDIPIENLCAPDFGDDYYQEAPLVLDYKQLEKVRIELLERGFNPGFDLERDPATDTQLMGAVAQFQAENDLPVTGQLDAATLAALYIPIRDMSPKSSDELILRAKPSK